MKSRLRELSRAIKELCESHMAYSQIVDIIQVTCDHIDARAYIEELHAHLAHSERKEAS